MTGKEKERLDTLDPISTPDMRSAEWTEYEFTTIDAVTEKAIMLDGGWYPKSQVKVDQDYNVYVTDWLLAKRSDREEDYEPPF